jgi:ferredoxin
MWWLIISLLQLLSLYRGRVHGFLQLQCSRSFPRPLLLYSLPESLDEVEQFQRVTYSVTVLYQNKSCEMQVEADETILSAMERQFSSRLVKQLDINEIPRDCRRGNCLTCAAKVVHNVSPKPTNMLAPNEQLVALNISHQPTASSESHLIRFEDGLSPYVSFMLQKSQYFLTCCTRVKSHGLTIEIGQNHKLWNAVYQNRFNSDATKRVSYSSMARAIRKSNEKEITQWMHRTEQLLWNEVSDEFSSSDRENLNPNDERSG